MDGSDRISDHKAEPPDLSIPGSELESEELLRV